MNAIRLAGYAGPKGLSILIPQVVLDSPTKKQVRNSKVPAFNPRSITVHGLSLDLHLHLDLVFVVLDPTLFHRDILVLASDLSLRFLAGLGGVGAFALGRRFSRRLARLAGSLRGSSWSSIGAIALFDQTTQADDAVINRTGGDISTRISHAQVELTEKTSTIAHVLGQGLVVEFHFQDFQLSQDAHEELASQ